jgi:hypothetical protein
MAPTRAAGQIRESPSEALAGLLSGVASERLAAESPRSVAMKRLLTLAAATAAMLAPLAAQADFLNRSDSYNGSLVFFAVDPNGFPTSMVADLSFKLDGLELQSRDPFITGDAGSLLSAATLSPYTTPGTSIVWNFADNSMTVNGVVQSATFSYSTVYNFFQSNAQSSETSWGVIASSSSTSNNFPNYALSTGNPTAAQLAAQTTGATTSLAVAGEGVYQNANARAINAKGVNTLIVADAVGASAVANETTLGSGYVLSNGSMGLQGDWSGSLKWSSLSREGGTNSFWFLNDSVDGATQLAGQFSYSAGVLTWNTAPVPEPNGVLLAFASLAVLAFAGARRVRR